MDIARQFFRLALLGAINHQVTHICVTGSIFESARQRCKLVSVKLGQLVTCQLCFGTWVSFLMALVFRPKLDRVIREDGSPPGPGALRGLAGFFADAFAIALAGRFFTEILAILQGQAAVKQEQTKLLEERERVLTQQASSPTPGS